MAVVSSPTYLPSLSGKVPISGQPTDIAAETYPFITDHRFQHHRNQMWWCSFESRIRWNGGILGPLEHRDPISWPVSRNRSKCQR
jgi:hypothetical protein